MDFSFDADQQALQALAKEVFGEKRAATADGLWEELARAGLSGLPVPVERGGSGLGVIELCLVLEQAGRAAAAPSLVPAFVGAAALARFGTPAQQARLDAVVSGASVVTLALHESGGEIERPAVRADRDVAGFRLHGVKVAVPALERASVIVVPARLPDGTTGLFLVAPGESGLRRDAARATDDTTVHQLTLEGVHVGEAEVLAAGRGDEALAWLVRRASVAWCAYELGIAARQLAMTAEYVVRRQQFGKPIGTFQAVAQRAADMHIDVESLRLATWQAACRPDDALAVSTAAWWAAEAGARVALAAQHLHGGMGFDRAYPLHRYFLIAKRVELELGGANRQLARLGKVLAATEVQS
ncbi:MAG: acyl-CoA dehydrogenase [Myxococcales bacterium]|nr:acyl-CoA dehydrogenase [Myxococcales bacterium]